MLIPLDQLLKKYNIPPRGVVHVGAHMAEESDIYNVCNFKNVVWIEGNAKLIPLIEEKLKPYPQQKIYQALIDREEKETEFHLTNNTQSSSIYALKEHAKQYPGIVVEKKIVSKTIRLDSFFKTHAIDLKDFNFINLDIQGNELNALKSLGEDLKYFDFIYTEVQVTQLYANSHNIHEMDRFLFSNGFEREETDLQYRSWGDALYVRKEKVDTFTNFIKSLQSRYLVFVWPAKKILYWLLDQTKYVIRTKILKQQPKP